MAKFVVNSSDTIAVRIETINSVFIRQNEETDLFEVVVRGDIHDTVFAAEETLDVAKTKAATVLASLEE